MTATYTSSHAGVSASRRSAGHIKQEYTHAIWVQSKNNQTWSCEAYSSRLDLAQKRAAEFSRETGWVQKVAIEPVTCEIKLTKRQKEWVAHPDFGKPLDAR
jgi:hypothetical protein